MYKALILVENEPPAATVYLTRHRLRRALHPVLAPALAVSAASVEPELIKRQRPDGSWSAKELEACSCLKQDVLDSLLIACGADRFHPRVLSDLQTGFSTLVGFLRLLMSGGFGFSDQGLPELRNALSEPAYDSAEKAFHWLERFGLTYPEMPVRLGLAAGIDMFCAAVVEVMVALEKGEEV